MKNVALLGSTGSIGTSALGIIEQFPDRYRVVALSAGKNLDLLAFQIRKFKPRAVAVLEEADASSLREKIPGGLPYVFAGVEGFARLAALDEVDTVISAITGSAGLIPTFAAVEAGKNVALANKETMVMAGSLVMEKAREKGINILPVDSEHSAIFQCLQGHPREDLRRIILTASGGPFRNMTLEELVSVTPEQALQHPNWSMGRKITIDSATLMNKGLEAIEARWLFDLKMDQISILIHPQSIIHSMVEYKDGSVIAQLGVPDMATPISYALSYPNHLETHVPPLRLEDAAALSFERCDRRKYRCLDLALRAAEIGDSMPAVMNGANEVAVEAFLEKRIGFLQIPQLIEKAMEAHAPFQVENIESVMEADAWARRKAEDLLKKMSR
ncbi:MAG: 1-deoxy-D-xylulose-5-phosphate reductoisomerase [Deltaproteobacteria bacterium]|nr:1-deoxy-D-xylulose-5-phosphate reductoisomerase [Deltaproteobacteria bacterium]MBW2128160.1 1-deoxy-D-xylulose-5-phosphate reductoisomerase [Deltaproteobacteria bacterium]MBW2302841.1 1-deoxy-D-xylulose-5-phosphate reductoisomerase [Deltaproteobacteria bacterium]